MFRSCFFTLLIILCAGAALYAETPDPKAVIAKVGDRSYSYKSFHDGFMAYLEYHGKGKTISAQDSVRLNNQYWEELVGIYIYDQAIKAGKIQVSKAELEAEIKRNVPDGVKQITDFHTNGKFDQKKYEQALKDRPEFKQMVIDHTRDLFSYGKLIQAIKNEVTVSSDSVKARWLTDNTKADATIIQFDYTRLDSIKVSNAEARMFYDEHLQEFKRENGRGYLLARFSGGLSRAENTEALAKENKNKSAALYTRAKEVGLKQAASEMNIKLEESPLFNAQDELIPLIGRAPALIAYAFANPIGSIPEIFYAPTGEMMVLELNREQAEYYISFEIKKQELIIRATRTKRMFFMDNYVREFVQKNSPETYLTAASLDSLKIVEAKDIIADTEIKGLGKVFELNKAILEGREGEFCPLLEKDKQWYLARTDKLYAADLSVWEKDKTSLINSAKTAKQQDHLNKWYLQQREKTEILDKRHEYYPLRQLIKM